MKPESCDLPICWAALRWERSRGKTEGVSAGRRIVGTRFYHNRNGWRSNALHTVSRQFLGNAYANVSVHTATSLQSTVTVKNTITLLLKEVVPCGSTYTYFRERTDQEKREYNRIQRRTEYIVRSRKLEIKSLVYVVSSLFVVTKCYSYSKIIWQLIIVPPGEYAVISLI
jgi:hypothetical protein